MNVWTLVNEPVESRPSIKKACFANETEVNLTSGWESATKSQRRKQRGKVEFLIEDHQVSDEDASDSPRAGDDAVSVDTANANAKKLSFVDIVNDESRPAEHTQTQGMKQNRKRQKPKTITRSNEEIIVHYLVREFLLMHCHEDIVRILDQERSMPALSATEVKHLTRRLIGTNRTWEITPVLPSLLERFLLCSNEARLQTTSKRSPKKRSTLVEKETSIPNLSANRRKPALNVITRDLDLTANESTVNTLVNKQHFNRLNHPGSTPHHHETIIGEPGSTPMAHTKNLHLFEFEDAGDEEVFKEVDERVDQFSHYAYRKRNLNIDRKRVQLGESGRTPTKEYIFFRETPPLFVTETIEDAVKIYEKLSSNAEFVNQAKVIERFIELQSSEVSKYTIGQVIEKLGPHYNINGVVSKIFGSRLCGTAGRGSIIVDTCPENLEQIACVEA